MIDVLSVVSEAYPLIKTGGLADVAGALPGALSHHGVAMRTLLPGYPAVMARLTRARVIKQLDNLFGAEARLVAMRVEGCDVIAIDAPDLYNRPGNPYVGTDGRDWPDNWRRFAALGWIAAELAMGMVEGYNPVVIHAHDWQAGLAPAYIKFGPVGHVKTMMTIHNIAFQGFFGADIFSQLRLPPHAFGINGVEFHGGVSYLKAGMSSADYVTTVSPNYADEIRTAQFGMGFEGLLNARADTVTGILNGIDMALWNPATDPALRCCYAANTIQARKVNKQAVVEQFGLAGGEGPLFCVVSRLTDQKGMDLLLQVIDGLVDLGGRLAVLGAGEAWLEDGFRHMASKHPGCVGLITGYNEALSHLVQGGGDAILIPSRFEPCGLTQLYGLRYGCVPVVSRIGGLADTIIDANPAALAAGVATGVVFAPHSAHALYEAIRKTVRLYDDGKLWKKIQRRGMKSDLSWETSAACYAELYAILAGLKSDDDQDH